MGKRDVRVDKRGAIRLMAEAEGWLLVRRPGCMPFVMTRKEWDTLPVLVPHGQLLPLSEWGQRESALRREVRARKKP